MVEAGAIARAADGELAVIVARLAGACPADIGKGAPMTNNRILVVDDEKLISWSLATMLGKNGYLVETAASGDEALAKAASFRPQLVMLDICLPDANGLDLLK